MEADSAAELGDYERTRARNIERNNARLLALGLISELEEKRSNAQAWGMEVLSQPSKKKRKMGNEERIQPKIPSRKSARLRGIEPVILGERNLASDENKEVREEDPNAFEPESAAERLARVEECRKARQRAALEVAKAGVESSGKENPTATYDHCLMRVKTMTPKRLANRVKAIERAAGKHCVVKMAIFKSCLQDKGMWQLAQQASDALERLKGLQPPPTD